MAIKWSSWESLGKPQESDIGRPFVQRNQDGRLEVFALGQGEIFNISQISPNGGWRDGWGSKGKPSPEVGIKSHPVRRSELANGTEWRLELVIYELHVGALGFGHSGEGNLADAIRLLDEHLVPLGVNAIELMPIAEFPGAKGWGYGDSHHFVIESSAGGRDQYKHFVRACHQRGIAVIQDVCYNHWDVRR
jgi:hypothetical protein